MTDGSFKNGLCDAGFSGLLTIPSILRGDHFPVVSMSSAVRHIFEFNCGERCVAADFHMKSQS